MLPEAVGYHFAEKLSESGESLIYRAQRDSDHLPVILKILNLPSPSDERLARFTREYEITAGLNVPGVIKAYGLAPYQNTLMMVLEDIGGESLARILKQRVLDLLEFLQLAIRLADILGRIHHHRVTHGNINPSDILWNPATGELRVIDFGSATALLKETPSPQSPYVLEGTLAYMSPEQTGRMNRAIDYRTDLYSLGVTFYEMLTGVTPFASDDPMELVHGLLAKTPLSPHERNPLIPPLVSLIVMRLLEKNAEDRYQSALGLKRDLEKCLAQLRETGSIETFELGEEDFSGRLQIPQKLYGRKKERKMLLGAFEGVTHGERELFLLGGYAGVGKTALVREIQQPVIAAGGRYIEGKYDQFQRGIPYQAWIQAFTGLANQWLTESASQLAGWKTRILEAVGNKGKVLTDVIPALEWVIGKQPPIPELDGVEARNRFDYVFQSFIKAIASREHPLAVFLDDLQWVDEASLTLLSALLTDPDIASFFVIGAYRDNEVDAAHPLLLTVEELQREGVRQERLLLQNLREDDVEALISDTLHCPPSDCRPLAKLVYSKTAGNAFFLHQLLDSLVDRALLTFDVEERRWVWEMEALRIVGISDNVVELLVGKIQKSPPATQGLLELAACIGNRFDTATLAVIAEKPEEALQGDLQVALQEGFILPAEEIYQFVHDRVQQAAYSLIAESERKAVHGKIGRLLLGSIPPDKRDERIFDIVNQLNRGDVELGEEKLELAELNQRAGKKANAATAYAAALEYFEAGIALLGAKSWEIRYPLTLALHQETAEACYLCGQYARMEELARIAHGQTLTLLDEIPLYETEIKALFAQNRMMAAIRQGLKTLDRLGLRLPEDPTEEEARRQLEKTFALLEKITIEGLPDLPWMTSPENLACMRILIGIGHPANLIAPRLFVLITSVLAEFSLLHGNSPWSSLAYSAYALVLIGWDDETSYRLGKTAAQLLDPPQAQAKKATVLDILGCMILPLKEPLRNGILVLEEGLASALETGDYLGGALNALNASILSYFAGEPLETLKHRILNNLNLISHFRQPFLWNLVAIVLLAVLRLKGETDSCDKLASFDEEQFIAKAIQANFIPGIVEFFLCKLMNAYLFEEDEQLLLASAGASEFMEQFQDTFPPRVFLFYDSLAYLRLCSKEEGTAHSPFLKRARDNQETLRDLARLAPMNLQHKVDLVDAEIARVVGEEWQAAELYQKAIVGARENRFIQEEALAYELAAKFYLALGMKEISKLYMNLAHRGYLRWQAWAKAKDLEKRYPNWLAPLESKTDETVLTTLDLDTVMKATRTISSEIVLERLLSKMMEIMVENAGAQKGFLVLKKNGEWVIEARGYVDKAEAKAQKSMIIEKKDALSSGVVNYVARTHDIVILDDAANQGAFANDPYIKKNNTKSVLCAPLLYQDRLRGIIYMENNLTIGAFTRDRVQILEILAAQAAISLENATFYETLNNLNLSLNKEIDVRKRAEEALRSLNETLEQRVLERTVQLEKANESLKQADRLKDEFLSIITHELRSPLNAILGFASVLDDEVLGPLNDQQHASLSKLIKGADRLLLLINDLLDFAKIRAGRFTISPEETSYDSLVAEAVESMAPLAKAKKLSIDTEVRVPQKVIIDPRYITQVLVNLLSNSIKFTPPEGKIHIRAFVRGEDLVTEVQDTGIGIKSEDLSRLFSPFQQLEAGLAYKVGGTGLGLSISKGIVEAHGGTITADSPGPGKGSTFWFRIPLTSGRLRNP